MIARVGVLREEAREGPAREAALQVDRLQEEQAVRAAQVVVVLAEGRRDVHDAGAVLHRNEVARQDAALGRGLRVLQAGVTEAQHAVAPVAGLVEALVLHAHQRRPGQRAHDRRRCQPHLLAVEPRLRQDQSLPPVRFDDGVRLARRDGQRRVARQRPGRRRPGDEVRLAGEAAQRGRQRLRQRAKLDRDAGVRRVLLVAQRQLVARQRGLAARAVGRHAPRLVDQIAVPQRLEDPPDRLHVLGVEGDVGVVHVDPERDPVRQVAPLRHVAHHRFPAAPVELGDAEGLDLGLGVQAQLPLHLQLHGQAVRVPARLAGGAVAAHRLVAREEVLVDAREDVVHAGRAVGRGRALVEAEQLAGRPLRDGALEDAALAPEVALALLHIEVGHGAAHGRESTAHRALRRMPAAGTQTARPTQGRADASVRGTTLLPPTPARPLREAPRGRQAPSGPVLTGGLRPRLLIRRGGARSGGGSGGMFDAGAGVSASTVRTRWCAVLPVDAVSVAAFDRAYAVAPGRINRVRVTTIAAWRTSRCDR